MVSLPAYHHKMFRSTAIVPVPACGVWWKLMHKMQRLFQWKPWIRVSTLLVSVALQGTTNSEQDSKVGQAKHSTLQKHSRRGMKPFGGRNKTASQPCRWNHDVSSSTDVGWSGLEHSRYSSFTSSALNKKSEARNCWHKVGRTPVCCKIRLDCWGAHCS